MNTGIFHAGFNPDELNARSFAGTLLRLFPNGSAPLFGMTSIAGRSTARATTHGYFTKTLTFSHVVADGEHLAAVTALTVDSTSGITPKMVLHNPTTQENVRVLTVDSATQITVTRGYGRIAAATIANDAKLVAIGTSFEQGSGRPVSRSLVTVHVSTFTQIFRNAWAVTDTARAHYTEMGFNNVSESKEDCAMLHGVDAESSIFFGQSKMDTSGSTPLHATQGIIDAIEQHAADNTNTANSTTDYGELVDMIEPAYKFSANLGTTKERTLFGGQTAVRVLNDIGRKSGEVQIFQEETAFGMQFTKFRFYKGVINIVEHPLFNGIEDMSGLAVVVDLPAVKLAYMDGRDTKPEEYGGTGRNNANGIDAVGGSLTTEFAVELINPAGCAVIYGLTAGVAE